jgi:putative addiction module component (TIGR02574 family)
MFTLMSGGRQERLTLVRLLLELDQPSNDAEIANARESEIRARVKAVDDGRISGVPYEQIKKETDRRVEIECTSF